MTEVCAVHIPSAFLVQMEYELNLQQMGLILVNLVCTRMK